MSNIYVVTDYHDKVKGAYLDSRGAADHIIRETALNKGGYRIALSGGFSKDSLIPAPYKVYVAKGDSIFESANVSDVIKARLEEVGISRG